MGQFSDGHQENRSTNRGGTASSKWLNTRFSVVVCPMFVTVVTRAWTFGEMRTVLVEQQEDHVTNGGGTASSKRLNTGYSVVVCRLFVMVVTRVGNSGGMTCWTLLTDI